MVPKQWIFFLLLILWAFSDVTSYKEEFCNEVHPSIYCSCTDKYKETVMSCFMTHEMQKDDELWTDMSEVEDVISLKLSSRVPVWLNYIPIDVLKKMPYLETLSIQQANFGVLQSHSVSGLKVLRELSLEGCEITELKTDAISNLPRLKNLGFSDNLLQEVLSDSLTGLLELENLFLDRNNISRIEGYAFSKLHNLRHLELWENELTDLTEYMFRGIRYLKRLDLSKNKIRILNDKIFHNLPKLFELDLHGNLISHIAPRAFHGLEKLQKLSLYSNKIKILPDIVFKSLPNLISVELYKNELETLQVQVLEHMDNSKVQHFHISFKDNPIKCDCRLSWVKTYLHFNASYQFTRELRQLQCTHEGGNTTLLTDLLQKMDCSDVIDQKSVITTSRSVTKQPAELVPYEIHKNKAMSTDAIADSVIISEDRAMEAEEKAEEEVGASPSGSRAIREDFHLIVFVTLLTVILVRKRKGTPI